MSRYLNLDAVERVDDAIPSTLREIEVDGQHEHRRGRHAPLWTDEFAVEEDDEGDADGDDGKDVVLIKQISGGKAGAGAAADPARTERMMRRDGAIVVQRWYRKQVMKFSVFGPMIFTRKDGGLADYGRLRFEVGNRSASWIRVSDTTSAATTRTFWRSTGSSAGPTFSSRHGLRRLHQADVAAAAASSTAASR